MVQEATVQIDARQILKLFGDCFAGGTWLGLPSKSEICDTADTHVGATIIRHFQFPWSRAAY